MSRANMGQQIANAPASRAAGMPGATRRMAMQAMAKPMRMAKGGKVRGDGCCMKGKTKGKMC